ncbi:MAG: hypothetical protein HPY66_2016 [Firmicutes bacterium]|nr:hypothetical protein [Bacillota bacterium]
MNILSSSESINDRLYLIAAMITGRKKEDVAAYLMNWPEEVRLKIEAVSMDMSRSYCYSVLECFP